MGNCVSSWLLKRRNEDIPRVPIFNNPISFVSNFLSLINLPYSIEPWPRPNGQVGVGQHHSSSMSLSQKTTWGIRKPTRRPTFSMQTALYDPLAMGGAGLLEWSIPWRRWTSVCVSISWHLVIEMIYMFRPRNLCYLNSIMKLDSSVCMRIE